LVGSCNGHFCECGIERPAVADDELRQFVHRMSILSAKGYQQGRGGNLIMMTRIRANLITLTGLTRLSGKYFC
jgi:hypothetical protein